MPKNISQENIFENEEFHEVMKKVIQSEIIVTGDKFAKFAQKFENQLQNPEIDVKGISSLQVNIENMEGFGKVFTQEGIQKVKNHLDKMVEKYNDVSLSDVPDAYLFALLQDQGLEKENLKNLKTKEGIVDFLNIFTAIDNENREIAGKELKIYPENFENGNELAKQTNSVLRYDTIESLQAKGIFDNIKPEIKHGNIMDNNYEDFLNKINKEKEQELEKNNLKNKIDLGL